MTRREQKLIESFRELTEEHQEDVLYLLKKRAEVARAIRQGEGVEAD